MSSYLVRVIPQRGFTTRRRSGKVFTVEGVVIPEGELTPAMRDDPGLIVTPVSDGETETLRRALERLEPARGEASAEVSEGQPQCPYVRANGERCKGRVKRGGRYCAFHTDDEGDGDGGGATVLTA